MVAMVAHLRLVLSAARQEMITSARMTSSATTRIRTTHRLGHGLELRDKTATVSAEVPRAVIVGKIADPTADTMKVVANESHGSDLNVTVLEETIGRVGMRAVMEKTKARHDLTEEATVGPHLGRTAS